MMEKIIICHSKEYIREFLVQNLKAALPESKAQVVNDKRQLADAMDAHPVWWLFMESATSGLKEQILDIKERKPLVKLVLIYDNILVSMQDIVEHRLEGALDINDHKENLISAFKSLSCGNYCYSGTLFQARQTEEVTQTPTLSRSEMKKLLLEKLSPTEAEVAMLVYENFKPKEIAKKLVISIDTVRTHLKHIYPKYHVHTYIQLINFLTILLSASFSAQRNATQKNFRGQG